MLNSLIYIKKSEAINLLKNYVHEMLNGVLPIKQHLKGPSLTT